ncbi:hypothetical protein ACQFYA_20860 [Promicromonospora sp. Marseille-Q5078]
MEETATEFANGRGREDYPLLSPRYAPSSRMPCVDFSPWIRDRLENDDPDAVIAYVLQIVAANPGIGIAIEMSPDLSTVLEAGLIPRESPDWATEWIERVRRLLRVQFDDLVGLSREAALDLRTALIQQLPHESYSNTPVLHGDGGLAAVMAPWPVTPLDPVGVMVSLNDRFAATTATVHLSDLAVFPSMPAALESLKALPLNSRSHLDVIASRPAAHGPGFERHYGSSYYIREQGCNDAQSLDALQQAGYVRTNDDAALRTELRLNALTMVELRRLLNQAAITHPRSARKSRLVELATPLVDTLPDEHGPVYELTAQGRDVADHLAQRTTETSRMWGAWLTHRFTGRRR